ncbi:SDR family NAD(P)-dependent oxidoreductase [Bacillus xiapuensis]|uniref:SDR family NAD(P)-dependent oxidoreductase n=1 Tax=Bacillus xiapuensis TaxID=2014075 RepID=UPI000C2336B4|nr:SDR family oxidoreductase [Bacillus xiapuensis]
MRNCVITGGGSGLGKELAIIYGQKGYHTHLISRQADKLASVQREIITAGGQATIHSLDLRNPAEIERLANRFLSKQQSIDLLINNAGIGIFGPFAEIDIDDLQTTFETNVYAPIIMTKIFLPLMTSGGSVINIISTAGLRGKKNEAIYCASKFALRGFTESLQKEFEPSRIRFVAVYMGGMNTPFWELSDHVKDTSKLKTPEEVASIIASQAKDKNEIIIESH